jgi:hypothetical protein
VSVSWGTWGEAEGHLPGISQRTASPGSVQIRVEGLNGAAVCIACSYECACFYILYSRVDRARVSRRQWEKHTGDGGGEE